MLYRGWEDRLHREQLIDAQQVMLPGAILVFLEPLYEGGLEGVTPGSSCIANAYTSNHDLIDSGQVGTTKSLVATPRPLWGAASTSAQGG